MWDIAPGAASIEEGGGTGLFSICFAKFQLLPSAGLGWTLKGRAEPGLL